MSETSHGRATVMLERLLKEILEGRVTGEFYLRIVANQGGIKHTSIGRWTEKSDRDQDGAARAPAVDPCAERVESQRCPRSKS